MPLFSVVLTQVTVVVVEAESPEALDAALDNEDNFVTMMEYLDDDSNWDAHTEIKAASDDASAELVLTNGVLFAVETT